MLQFVKDFYNFIFEPDPRTEFQKLADEMQVTIEQTVLAPSDCEKVAALISVLQEWSIKHCSILDETLP